MKRLFALLLCLMILCCFAGCDYRFKHLFPDDFYCKTRDENNVAIGRVRTFPESGAVFFPEKIENYTVTQLGFASGFGFGGNGYFYPRGPEGSTRIKRCYFPHTIETVSCDYMRYARGNKMKLFYCGEIIDLNDLDDKTFEIYVPAEKYALFEEALTKEYFRGSLLKADVSYYLNYDENNYYYVDYYENGEKILYIPPEPQRDGYSFVGWFKESGCLNRWDFEVDALQITEEMQEIKLFAKWESVDQ